MRRIQLAIAVMLTAAAVAACNKPVIKGTVSRDVRYQRHTYAATPNQCYYALRWALKMNGYTITQENLMDGILTTAWKPVTSDSHYIPLFDRRDFGASAAYHQIEVRVVPEGQRTRVDIGSRAKSIVHNLQSSGVEERKILAEVGNYLRSDQPDISNTGINE